MDRFARVFFIVAACLIGACAALCSISPATAQIYSFRVNCKDEDYIALWAPGPVNPGKDYFRNATGHANLDCSIYDYDAKTDRNLPQRWCDYPGGIIEGFPVLLILTGMSHCK